MYEKECKLGAVQAVLLLKIEMFDLAGVQCDWRRYAFYKGLGALWQFLNVIFGDCVYLRIARRKKRRSVNKHRDFNQVLDQIGCSVDTVFRSVCAEFALQQCFP